MDKFLMLMLQVSFYNVHTASTGEQPILAAKRVKVAGGTKKQEGYLADYCADFFALDDLH